MTLISCVHSGSPMDQDAEDDTDRVDDDPFTKITPNTAAALNTLTDPRLLHVKYQYSDQGTKTCLRCNKQFDDFQVLARHVQQHILQVGTQNMD